MTLFEKIITTISYLKQPTKRRMIQLAATFKGQEGIEVGGPSAFFSFKSAFPIYLYANKIDGVNTYFIRKESARVLGVKRSIRSQVALETALEREPNKKVKDRIIWALNVLQTPPPKELPLL